jgi:HSP20 family molecular chaperone IbpA
MYTTTYYINSQITDAVTQAVNDQITDSVTSTNTRPPWPCYTYSLHQSPVFEGETENGYKLIINVAGCSKEDVSATYITEDKKINIKALIKMGDFKRDYSSSYFVGSKFDLDEMKCFLKNGLLVIDVPYKKSAKPKEVKIS